MPTTDLTRPTGVATAADIAAGLRAFAALGSS